MAKKMKREWLYAEREMFKWDAFSKNKRVMVTIPNPNVKTESNKPFIRVTAQEAGWKKQEPYKMKQEGQCYKYIVTGVYYVGIYRCTSTK